MHAVQLLLLFYDSSDYYNTRQLECSNILNNSDLDENLKMVKSLIHLTASLQDDDTTSSLTKVYRKFLKVKSEKFELNSKQTVIRDFYQYSGNTEQPMNH